MKDQLVKYVNSLPNVQKDHPFSKFPEYQVFRHEKSGKWFGLVMTVERDKLGLSGEGEIEIIDVKADPEEISILVHAPGYLPGYHMNKNHWIAILLDGSVADEQIFQMLENSYQLTS
jgi:predicted DNA-binding protein (MmcQ/YjbR family)